MASLVRLDRDLESTREEVEKLVTLIRPQWDPNDVTLKAMMGGLINAMWKVSNANYPDDVIAVKIYGAENNHIFDRKKELQLMEELDERNITAKLYARFGNGIAYKFTPGSTLTPEQLLDLNISRLVIAKMHEIHQYENSAYTAADSRITIETVLAGWKAYQHLVIDTPEFKKIFDQDEFFVSVDNTLAEYIDLFGQVEPCFCHMDMHMLNLIYDNNNNEISVIDWEIAGLHSPITDIARHLAVSPDNSVPDAGILIPEKKDFVEAFVRLYLETDPQYGKEPVSQQMVDKWLRLTYWAIENTVMVNILWALIQWVTRSGRDFLIFAEGSEKIRQSARKMLRENFN